MQRSQRVFLLSNNMAAAAEHKTIKLVGYANFKRHNPRSDRFVCYKFHHVEFWTGDAQNTAARFGWALGMNMIAKSDQSTGNHHYASQVMRSNDMTFVFSAPYSTTIDKSKSQPPHPQYNAYEAHEFTKRHGFGVRAIGVLVEDAVQAYEAVTANGGVGACPPQKLVDPNHEGYLMIAEMKLFGDAVMRFVSKHGGYKGPFFPLYQAVESPVFSYGIQRLDHVVNNTPNLSDAVNYFARATGFHEFGEFTTEDVGTVDSGLNSMVMANNNEMVLMPINEPTFGTKRKSQIQNYLEQNEGAGVQHIAVKTNDIFATLREMMQRRYLGGFEFVPRPSDSYYRNLHARIGDALTEEQYKQCEELGVLVDKDDLGVLLQIFTRPVCDRATVFFEIIQRVGCMDKVDEQKAAEALLPDGEKLDMQVGGCGGFGKGNFAELFKSIEDYERLLDGSAKLNEKGSIEIVSGM